MRLGILFALLFAVVVAVVLLLRGSGPRVTHIEQRRETDDKDRDDA